MAWTTALQDLRVALNDGPTDKLRYRKGVVGTIDGTNTIFKTFEYRRVSDFLVDTAPIGVFVNGTNVAVLGDVPSIGEFTLAIAPAALSAVEATYYVQWFDDSELNTTLNISAQNVGFTLPSQVPDGLKQCAIEYSKFLSYQKMAMRWKEWLSDTYKYQDSVKQDNAAVDSFLQISNEALTNFQKMRNDYYRRQGRSLQPLFGVQIGNVPDVPPKR